MDKDVGIGLIIGLSIGMILYAANSERFSQAQRVSIYVFIIFPPLQLLLFIIYLIYNSQKKEEPKILSETEIFNDKIASLKELKDSGLLTDEEYSQKSKNIENSKLEAQIKDLSSYKKLKSLLDDGVLTKEEFKNKADILKNSLKNSDYKLHKVKEYLSNVYLGRHTEYKITFKNGGEYNNVYQKFSESGYYIKRNSEILFFETIEDLLIFIKK